MCANRIVDLALCEFRREPVFFLQAVPRWSAARDQDLERVGVGDN